MVKALQGIKYSLVGLLALTFSLAFLPEVPQAQAAGCTVPATFYVDAVGGSDKGSSMMFGCWGRDSTHAFETVQFAINEMNSRYASNGGSATPTLIYTTDHKVEPIDNTGGIFYTIVPASGKANTNGTFEITGQNITLTSFTFNAGGVKVYGTSKAIKVQSNRFNVSSTVEIKKNSEVYLTGNTFNNMYIYVHDNTARVSIWSNWFQGFAPNVTINYGRYTTNYGNWYVFVENQTSGGFDFVGNTVTSGQALNMRTSSGAIIMSNTVSGTSVTSDIEFYLYDTDVASFVNNVIGLAGKGVQIYGWSKVPTIGYVDKNTFNMLNDTTSQSYGIQITGANVSTVKQNQITNTDTAITLDTSSVPLVDSNTVASSSVGILVHKGTIGTISNNALGSTSQKGIYVFDNSTVDVIEKNSFGDGEIGILMESNSGDFSDSESNEGSAATTMSAGTKIRNNTFQGTELGIGLHSTLVKTVEGNVMTSVMSGVKSYYATITKIQSNQLDHRTGTSGLGILLESTMLTDLKQNLVSNFDSGVQLTDGTQITGTFSRNTLSGGTYGLYVDNATLTPVLNNLFLGQTYGIEVMSGPGFKVLFNTFYNQATADLAMDGALTSPMDIANNVFSAFGSRAIQTTAQSNVGVLDYNLYDKATGSTLYKNTSTGMNYVLNSLRGLGFEAEAIESNGTALKSPGTGNYQLNSTSLAVNSADDSYGVGSDFNQNGRPYCVVSDRGAFEAGSNMFGMPATDSDGDGLCSFQESGWGSSDTNADSDSDGLGDYEETYVYGTGVTVSDTDADSYADGEEVDFGTDPLDASSHPNDADHDHMDDGWESTYGLDPTDSSDASEDLDSDGRTNLDEYREGTDPTDSDSDDDALSDGDEASYGTDPLDSDTDADSFTDGVEADYGSDPLDGASTPSTLDTDSDGLSDYDENTVYGTDRTDSDSDGDLLTDGDEVLTYGSDPLDTDTDGDTLSDGEEVLTYGSSPTDTDTDSDGLTDEEEVIAGTDPSDSDTDADAYSDLEEILSGSDPLDASSTPSTVDTDGDGLSDILEAYYGTDASDVDSDGDGLLDGEEVLTYGTDPSDTDTDDDGLTDYQEQITYGTDPNDTDTDSDGLSDYDELLIFGSDPTDSDTDGDGLSDSEELTYGTDLNETDTDGDLLSDGDEVTMYLSDPTDSDTDGDGLSDGDEASYGTSVIETDTDGDGLDDYAELITYGTDATNADTDADGYSDYAELTGGSDPFDSSSTPSTIDTDADGLTDYQETYTYGTDPNDSDTDSDGLSDYVEVVTYGTDATAADTDSDGYSDYDELLTYGTDPLDAGSSPAPLDTDGDGLSDTDEASYGTDPAVSDTDADGLNDYQEVVTYGTDPLDTDSDDDTLGDYQEAVSYGTDPNDQDTDGDLYTDWYEISQGSTATSSSSKPALDLTITFYQNYVGESSSTGSWSDLSGAGITYTSAVSSSFEYGVQRNIETSFNRYGAIGIDYDSTAYLGSVDVQYCGTNTSAWDASSVACTPSTEYASSTSPNTELTHVTSSSLLEVWSYLSSYYTFSNYTWYRTPVGSGTVYDAFGITLN